MELRGVVLADGTWFIKEMFMTCPFLIGHGPLTFVGPGQVSFPHLSWNSFAFLLFLLLLLFCCFY